MKLVESQIRNRRFGYQVAAGFLLVSVLALGETFSGWAASTPANEQVAKLTAVLQSGAPQKEKADACRELARIGTKESVAALAVLLPDESLSHMARYGLETIPDPAVDLAFRDALGKLKGRQLAGVISSIGMRQDAKAVNQLTKLLADADPDVAQAAARALGRIGTPAAGKALQNALPKVAPANQVALCEGLFRCAEKLAADGKSKQAIAIYDQVRKLQTPHQVRTAALRGAVLARGNAGLPLLQEFLRDPDYAVFAAAARISSEMPGQEVTAALAAQLRNNSVDKQILLTQTLGKRQDPAALPALFAAAQECDKPVRLAAIRAISELCNPSAVRVFQQLLTDKDTEIAAEAKDALGGLPGPEADSAALFMLRSTDPNRRDLGFELIGRRRLTSAIPDLFKMAGDREPGVRTAALRRVGELGGAKELPGMLELLSNASTPQDLEAVEQALSTIAVKSPGDATANELVQAFGKAAAPQKCALVRVMAAVGGPKALEGVRLAVKDPSSEVKTSALRALGTWSSVEAAPDLLELARSTADRGEKMLCLRGYFGLAGQSELPPEKALGMCRDAAGMAQQADEKKLLLSCLGNIQSPASLELIVPYLEDASVKEEAATACVTLSKKLLQGQDAARNAGRLVEPLRKVAGADVSSANQAKQLLEQAQNKSQGK